MTVFDILNCLTDKKEELDFNQDEVKKEYNNFMINRWISGSEIFVPLVNAINKYNIPSNIHFKYYFSSLPKRKQYFKYPKKGKEVNKEEKECIMKYYEIGKNECEEYINMLTEQQIKKIVSKYESGKTK